MGLPWAELEAEGCPRLGAISIENGSMDLQIAPLLRQDGITNGE